MTNGFNYYPATSTGWGITTTSGTAYPAVFTTGPMTVAATPAPRKRSPLEWLEDEVERVCALTRPGLA